MVFRLSGKVNVIKYREWLISAADGSLGGR